MPGVALPPWADAPDPVHPLPGSGDGPCLCLRMSDPGGPTRSDAFVAQPTPGGRSECRHWREPEDAMVPVIEGQVVPAGDWETLLRAGVFAAGPAGRPVGLRPDNRSDRPARYPVIGARNRHDRVHSTDHAPITEKDSSARRHLHADGPLRGVRP